MKPELKQTSNYSLFALDSTNRSVENIAKIKASLQKFGFLPSHPLHVVRRDRKLVVIDGQHRLVASKTLGIPVYYVVCQDSEISIPQINSAQRAWSGIDYVKSFSAQGNQDYRTLSDFIQETGIPLTVASALLSGETKSGGQCSKVKLGTFRVKTLDLAYVVAKIIIAASRHVRWSRNSLFIDALSRCARLPEFDANHFVKKMDAMPGNLRLQPTRADFLEMIEGVYNYKSRIQVPLKYLAERAAIERNPVKLSEEAA